MYMRLSIGAILICFSILLFGQNDVGLISYVNFDGCNQNDLQGNFSTTIGGNPICVCGAIGDGLEFDGMNDFIDFSGPFENLFVGNYTISFYFQPKSSVGNQDLISLRVGCDIDSILAISYAGPGREIVVELFQNINRNEFITHPIDLNACWQHIVLVKNEKVLTLYLNGRRIVEEENSQVISVANKGTLSLSNSPCIGINQERFEGAIDDLRFYNRALSFQESLELYTRPDEIITQDTTILLGAGVEIRLSESCAQSYQWFPTNGVSNSNAPDATLSPQVTTAYQLNFNLLGCTVYDTIQVTVVDPSNVDCNEIFLPKAFTPNGDGLNENYGISNPYVFERLIAFEIFSSWGEKLFETQDPYGRWNGDYRGNAVNPGVFVYKLVYICSGDELTKTGSFSILR